MDLRSELEKDLQDIVIDCLDLLTQEKLSRGQIQKLMGGLRDINVRLTNRRFGCVSGRHASACECVNMKVA